MLMSRMTFLVAAVLAAPALSATTTPGGGNRLLMTTYWGDDRVALIDIQGRTQGEELWSIDVAKAANCLKPYDVRVTKGGATAFVSCSGAKHIIAIDVAAQQVQYAIETGGAPRDLQLFDNDRKLIVANSGSDTVSVVDLTTRKKLYDFPVAVQPYGVALADGGKTALITGWASGDLHIVALGETSAKTRAVVPVGLLPYTVITSPQLGRAYVAVNAEDRVTVVDLKTAKVAEHVAVGRGPWSLAGSLDGKSILVTNNRSNSLSYMNVVGSAEEQDRIATFAAGAHGTVQRRPKNASLSADGATAAFTDLAADQIVVLDVASGKLARVIQGGKAPYGIEFLR
jgi:YVTN family beta-propeller protein